MGDFFEPTGGGTTTVSALSGGQNTLLDLITSQLAGQFQGGQLQGLTPFQGTRPGEVPFGPLQQQAFGLAGGLAPGIGAGLDIFGQTLGGFDPSQGQGLLGQAQGALTQGLGFDPTQDILQAFEPSRQLATREFERTTVPGLLEQFGATSGASGSLDRALAEAGAGLQLGLSAQTAPFIGQAALNQPGQQFQGAGLAGQLAGIPGQLAGQGLGIGGGSADILRQLLGFGGAQQQLPQGIAAANQQRFLESQPFANQLFNQLAGLGLGTQAIQTFQDPSGPSQFSQIGSLFGSQGAFGSGSQGGTFGSFAFPPVA